MTSRRGALAPADVYFGDALQGSDGTADPIPVRSASTYFADPLLAPPTGSADGEIRVVLPPVASPPAIDPSQWISEEVVPSAGAPGPGMTSYVAPAVAPTPGMTSYAPPDPRQRRPHGTMPPPAPHLQLDYARQQAPPGMQLVRMQQPRAQQPRMQLPRTQAPRTQPVRTRTPARPAARPRSGTPAKKSGGGALMGFLVLVVLFLVMSGAGQEILDAIMNALNQ